MRKSKPIIDNPKAKQLETKLKNSGEAQTIAKEIIDKASVYKGFVDKVCENKKKAKPTQNQNIRDQFQGGKMEKKYQGQTKRCQTVSQN